MARRYKTAYISNREIIDLFVNPKSMDIKLEGVPEGYTVRYCFQDCFRDAFGIVIEHESFPEVPDCEYPPILNLVYIKKEESWRNQGQML